MKLGQDNQITLTEGVKLTQNKSFSHEYIGLSIADPALLKTPGLTNFNNYSENPQTPLISDLQTSTADLNRFTILSVYSDEVDFNEEEKLPIDPDRPPISSSDRRKLKNLFRSKEKK